MTVIRGALTAPPRDDLSEIYGQAAAPLRRLVADGVRLPDAVVDDACQVAWCRFVRHRERVASQATLAWLLRTAVHEAWRLARRGEREVSLEALREREDEREGEGEGWEALVGVDPTDDLVVHLTRVEALRTLPPRQQRLVWLRACGLSYREIAASTGDSERTVERQLTRARERLRTGEG